jgi:hypothetical protein
MCLSRVTLLSEQIGVRRRFKQTVCLSALCLMLPLIAFSAIPNPERPVRSTPDPSTLAAKVMAGYQGWFRCPGDRAGFGWVHWSRDAKRIAPDTLTFEMWPDMREYAKKYAAPGFTHPDGSQATLFSDEDYQTVLTHFRWMRDHDIDGVWLQHFAVDLQGGPLSDRYESRMRVLRNVQRAAAATGRVWVLTYDIAGMRLEQIYDVVTADWKRMVQRGITKDRRYLHEKGLPVVMVWGFYKGNDHNAMDAPLANRLIDFFKADGPCKAYLVGGGDWNWRANPDPEWQRFLRRFDAYSPWNVGNYALDEHGLKHASMGMWEGDRQEMEKAGVRWIPVVYPGFGWDNLMRKAPHTTDIERRKGAFYWEQFVRLARMKVDMAYLAMFDEVDEGTAIFKISDTPPVEAHFDTLEGMPSDWYLRLAREGIRMLRGQRPVSEAIPIKP